jgi:hypothetical protein
MLNPPGIVVAEIIRDGDLKLIAITLHYPASSSARRVPDKK